MHVAGGFGKQRCCEKPDWAGCGSSYSQAKIAEAVGSRAQFIGHLGEPGVGPHWGSAKRAGVGLGGVEAFLGGEGSGEVAGHALLCVFVEVSMRISEGSWGSTEKFGEIVAATCDFGLQGIRGDGSEPGVGLGVGSKFDAVVSPSEDLAGRHDGEGAKTIGFVPLICFPNRLGDYEDGCAEAEVAEHRKGVFGDILIGIVEGQHHRFGRQGLMGSAPG